MAAEEAAEEAEAEAEATRARQEVARSAAGRRQPTDKGYPWSSP